MEIAAPAIDKISLSQWVEDCNDFEVCQVETQDDVETPIEVFDEPSAPQDEYPGAWTGELYFGWLVSPVVHVLAATVTAFSGDGSLHALWLALIGWDVGVAYFSLMWFHEHSVGGPLE